MHKVLFEPEAHRYFSDGNEYPSVTKIIDHFELSPDYERFGTDASRDFGKAVHRVCELHDKNDLGNYDTALEPYLNGYKKFLDHFKPKWQLIETPLMSKIWGFAGTPDRFGIIKKNTLIDLKSGSAEPCHQIQTGAYKILVEENLKIKVRERLSLYLMPNDFRLIEHKNRCDESIFKGLAQAYIWKQNKGVFRG